MPRYLAAPLALSDDHGPATQLHDLRKGADYLTWQMLHYATPAFNDQGTIDTSRIARCLLAFDNRQLGDVMNDAFDKADFSMKMAVRIAALEPNTNARKLAPLPAHNPGSTVAVCQAAEAPLLEAARKLFDRPNSMIGLHMVREALGLYAHRSTMSANTLM